MSLSPLRVTVVSQKVVTIMDSEAPATLDERVGFRYLWGPPSYLINFSRFRELDLFLRKFSAELNLGRKIFRENKLKYDRRSESKFCHAFSQGSFITKINIQWHNKIQNFGYFPHIYHRHRYISPAVKSISRKYPGKNRCPASEGRSSQPATPLPCFKSDVPIVLTSLKEKGESLMGQDRGCRPSDPISPIPGNEYVLLYPVLCGILHYRSKTKSLNASNSGLQFGEGVAIACSIDGS
ncbi:hypothetical protein AVEN_188389-1 [Araneus ventricosus]|uniref:Uncharacterized protein n=1 Tax=Araneus ventricosus TaxID=182803 RepID=A0A4Y2E9N6_ARAVE|nr:hypothetical protein AVEN_188389-1 [Araneus ventricosus]